MVFESVGPCIPGPSTLQANLVALVIGSARVMVDVTSIRSPDPAGFRLQHGLPQGITDTDLRGRGCDVDSLTGVGIRSSAPVAPEPGRTEEGRGGRARGRTR